jgi:hypothetical protein
MKSIREDSDRYALATMAALQRMFNLSAREASIHASALNGNTPKPETIRSKARTWRRRARLVRNRFESRLEPMLRKLWIEDVRRLERLSHAVAVAIKPGKRSMEQSVNEVMTYAESAREKRYAKRVLIPFLSGEGSFVGKDAF